MLLQVLSVSLLLSSFLLGCIDLTPSGEMVRDSGERGGNKAMPDTQGGAMLMGGSVSTPGGIGGHVTESGGVVLDSGIDVSSSLDAFDSPEESLVVGGDAKTDLILDGSENEVAGDAVSLGGLLAHYRCEGSDGTLLADDSGNLHHAVLHGLYGFSKGAIENALVLGTANGNDGGSTNGYAELPVGLLKSVEETTIAVWVKLKSNPRWSRVFDFGSGVNTYMFLTPNNESNGGIRFTITTNSVSTDQFMDGPVVTVGVWTHVAIVLDGVRGRMYVNGLEKASETAIKLRPSSLGVTTNNWIGRSQYTINDADPYFDGQIDDFRIYNRALNAIEIEALAKL